MYATDVMFTIAASVVCLAGADRPGRILFNEMGFSNGIDLHIEVVAEPPANSRTETGISYTNQRLHRFLSDDTHRIYFGYDLKAEPLSGGRIRVNIDPLSLTVDDLDKFAEKKKFSAFRYIMIPRCPPAQTIHAGDTIALDLLVSPDGKQKIVDYLDFSLRNRAESPEKTQ